MAGETDLIKERLDVADIIGEYVPLKRVGMHFKGLCPFHQEKTPSFIVSPEKGIWHCFGCGKGGDVFAFVQEIEGVDFPEALKQLAERAGVTLERTGKPHFAEATRGRQRLFDLLDTAARFYHTLLMQHQAGKKARAYLAERGVAEVTLREFEVGYAPMRWDTLQQFLQKKGFITEEMIQVGLVGKGQGGKLYDRFRGRIMFPVLDVQGRVVAFGGRIVPWHATGEEGKYINSPETAFYEKRKVVYNLSRAKAELRHGQACVVVEGYMDVVMLHQAGVGNVVATSGTAFTAEHVQLLSRYTQTLHFAFDADTAGRGATIAATEAALSAGMRVATIVLPPGEDPADIVAKHPQDVATIFSQPQSLLSVLMARLSAETEPRERETQLAALLPLLKHVRNAVLKGEMVQEVAETLAIPVADVLRQVEYVARDVGVRSVRGNEEGESSPLLSAEHVFLGILLLSGPARAAVWERVSHELFVDEAARELYNTMHNLAQTIMDWEELNEEAIVAALPAEQRTFAHALTTLAGDTLSRSPETASHEAQMMLRALKRRYLSQQLQTMQRKLAQVSAEEKEGALQQFQQVAEELATVTSQEA